MKNLLLFTALLLSNAFYAQFPVWVNSFDTADDLAGWTIHDLNSNGNKWVQGQNIYHNGTSLAYGTSGVLRFSINMVPTGNASGFGTENDWIISPEIDLTQASGTITLAAYIGRQRATHASVSRGLYIYESTAQKPVPDLSDFQSMAVDENGSQENYPYSIGSGAFPADLQQFVESQVNISAFAGKKIYIGLWSNRISSGSALNAQNINIDEMGIFATVLSTNDLEKGKNVTQILQNPASFQLILNLNPSIAQESAMIKVYNLVGQEVLSAPYTVNTDITSLQAGTYIVRITGGNVDEKLKFIKQ